MFDTSRNSDVQVVIVGAGPVGLTLALGLTRLGVGVRVLDRAPSSKRQARAAVIWPRVSEVLQDLGVLEPFLQRGNRLESVDVVAFGRRLGGLDLGHLDTRIPWPLVIEQNDTEHLLATALSDAGAHVEWNRQVTGMEVHGDGVVLSVRHLDRGSSARDRRGAARDEDEEKLEVPWVVGADGSSSVIRQSAGIAHEGRRRPNLQVLQVNAHPRWDLSAPDTHGWFFLEPEASLGVFAIPGGGYRFFCFTVDPDPTLTEPPSLTDMRDLISRLTGQPQLELTPTEPRWFNRARFQDRVAATLHRGRVLLVGDAAHTWAPIGGHGMNAGMRGAHNLAWKLAAVVHGTATAELLDTYDVEQRHTAAAVISEMRFNVLELPLPPHLYWPVVAGMPLALATTTIRRRIEYQLSDLGMHHEDSPLSVDRLTSGARRQLHLPRAGHRLPNHRTRIDGRAGSLHEHLRYDHWTALTTDPAHLPTLRQALSHHRVALHVMRTGTASVPAILLVRPDGYIGYQGDCRDLDGLAGYLDRLPSLYGD